MLLLTTTLLASSAIAKAIPELTPRSANDNQGTIDVVDVRYNAPYPPQGYYNNYLQPPPGGIDPAFFAEMGQPSVYPTVDTSSTALFSVTTTSGTTDSSVTTSSAPTSSATKTKKSKKTSKGTKTTSSFSSTDVSSPVISTPFPTVTSTPQTKQTSVDLANVASSSNASVTSVLAATKASANQASKTSDYLQQDPSEDTLIPGEVFGLVTLSDDPTVDKETVVIYNDGTLGIKEPTSPGYLFEALLLNEYGLLVAPEPLKTVKLNDQNIFFLNDSLFNPTTLFSSKGWALNAEGGSTVVCPSWNSVLTYVPINEQAKCEDAVPVQLRIVPIAGDN